MFTVSLVKIVLLIWSSHPTYAPSETTLPSVDEWLDSENLSSYKQLFRDKGEFF
ncbi:hypothetical protein KR032_008454 [Drosophila birchii]|nr:hypothetical protein KR032_008454 [Drosophila birchii]